MERDRSAVGAETAGRQASPAGPRPEPPSWSGLQILTLGHSTRSQEELLELLQTAEIDTLADIRSFPRSRHNPQFNEDVLGELLPTCGIRYLHLGKLGGRRHGLGADSPNGGWHHEAFRSFADYAQTPAFEEGLAELRELAEEGHVAIMCAEAVPWRCHRTIVSDYLVSRGAVVHHVVGKERIQPHRITPFARVDHDRISYPPEEPSLEERSLAGRAHMAAEEDSQ